MRRELSPAARSFRADPRHGSRLDQGPCPCVAGIGDVCSQFVRIAVMEDADILALIQLLAKSQNLRVGFVGSVLEADQHLAHRHGRVVAALGGEQKKFSKLIAWPPIILEDLNEVCTPATLSDMMLRLPAI